MMTAGFKGDYGSALLDLREHFELSQAEAARTVGVNSVSWCRWEGGRPMPELTYLGIHKKLCDELCGDGEDDSAE